MTRLYLADGVRPDRGDPIGATVSIAAMAILGFGPRG
jgi:drug/metabolite transporter superfamily protein YnfA